MRMQTKARIMVLRLGAFLFSATVLMTSRSAALGVSRPDVTTALDDRFSKFKLLLIKSGVAEQINSLKSATLLAPPDSALPASTSPFTAQDLRYYVLIQYVDYSQLQVITNGINGSITIPTLLFLLSSPASPPNVVGSSILIKKGEGGSLYAVSGVSGSLPVKILGNVAHYPFQLSVLEIAGVLPRINVTNVPNAFSPFKAEAPSFSVPNSPTASPSSFPPAPSSVTSNNRGNGIWIVASCIANSMFFMYFL